MRILFLFFIFFGLLYGATLESKNPNFWHKVNDYFFGVESYKARQKSAEDSYKYYMKILEHEGTYFTLQYSLPPYGIYGNNIPTELKFQLSFKVPLWRGALWTKGSVFFAYTQTMWFQQFNYRYSSPVRDSTYKPYVFYTYPLEWGFGSKNDTFGRIKELRAGIIHYSNGIGGDDCVRSSPEYAQGLCRSRSAGTRFMAEVIWEKEWGNHTFGAHLSVWPYLPERRDNADLADYMGYGDLKLYYRHKRHLLELQILPVIADYTRYHGGFRLGYAFAVNHYFSLYAQYFYGYHDSLYEYNIKSNRIGLGLRVSSF